MTIEEMEAELQEFNEAIRKRRRKTPGLTLKPLWVLTALAYLGGNLAEAFTAYDCRLHQQEQCGGGLLASRAGCLCQLRQGR